jgi:hypothetical protein
VSVQADLEPGEIAADLVSDSVLADDRGGISPLPLELPLQPYETCIIDTSRVPWVQPPPIANCKGSEGWVYYVFTQHQKTFRDIFLATQRADAKACRFLYYDRMNKAVIALDRPLLVPAGLRDIERFGIPFPSIPCIAHYETNNKGEITNPMGKWLYLQQMPAGGDVGRRLRKPFAQELPLLGASPQLAVPTTNSDSKMDDTGEKKNFSIRLDIV